jgi:hypothetical protein
MIARILALLFLGVLTVLAVLLMFAIALVPVLGPLLF